MIKSPDKQQVIQDNFSAKPSKDGQSKKGNYSRVYLPKKERIELPIGFPFKNSEWL
ncbi:hypothetical protein ACFQZI_02110 [Mucilaginibacter lutimaris]|uniref:Uncharacterized protein n=1 Tax=Mucilaginibacter lutimaris TaxID=931629 RepID=A0ABW2ZCL8_9SPHI